MNLRLETGRSNSGFQQLCDNYRKSQSSVCQYCFYNKGFMWIHKVFNLLDWMAVSTLGSCMEMTEVATLDQLQFQYFYFPWKSWPLLADTG